MKKSSLLKVLTVIVTGVALGSSPQNAFAQRGGHGGGGAFHGVGGMGVHGGGGMGFPGGGGVGFHSPAVGGLHSVGGRYGNGRGHFYGGHHGGAYYTGRGYNGYHAGYGWHGGHHGWHGGYRWYPYYGWGWGFGWPYWGWGYGYYGYNPWYFAPYSYPDYCPPGYSCPPNGNDDPPPGNSTPKPGQTPAKPWRPEESTPDTDDGSSNVSARLNASVRSSEGAMIMASNYRVARSNPQEYTPLRREVQNAMRALREMPPFARQREIETGRYSHFTAEERALLRNAQ
jgi:hypothetical protein